MKKLISLFLSACMILTGCAKPSSQPKVSNNQEEASTQTATEAAVRKDVEVSYDSLGDEKLLNHVKDLVYMEAVTTLNSEEYFVDNVEAVYVSKEYIEDLAYNSMSNIFFGYTLAELEDLFQGTKYVFTLGDDEQTMVEQLEDTQEIRTEEMLKNVAIGAGVILVCVTISAVTYGAAPAISMIFMYSAAGAAIGATTIAAIGAMTKGCLTAIETGDLNESLEAAQIGAATGFKWGAIVGAIIGGAYEAKTVSGLTEKGLSLNDAAKIQRISKFPLDVIKQFHNYDEFKVYEQAGLRAEIVDGKIALVQDIDINFENVLSNGKVETNLERMLRGAAPIDPETGLSYQLHHVGQANDGTLAILKVGQHLSNGKILNIAGKSSEIDRVNFNEVVRPSFWRSFATSLASS